MLRKLSRGGFFPLNLFAQAATSITKNKGLQNILFYTMIGVLVYLIFKFVVPFVAGLIEDLKGGSEMSDAEYTEYKHTKSKQAARFLTANKTQSFSPSRFRLVA